MLRPLFSKVAGRLLALTSESYDGLARQQSETVWASQMSACALSSSVAESEQDKTMLQRVVMNRAWPKPSMGFPVSPPRIISFHGSSRKLGQGPRLRCVGAIER